MPWSTSRDASVRAHSVPMADRADCDPATTWLKPTRPSSTEAPGLDASTPTVTGEEGGGAGGMTICCSLMSRVEAPLTPVKVKLVRPAVELHPAAKVSMDWSATKLAVTGS